MEVPEVASKPPSKGLLIQEPPSELVIQTERHPSCGFHGWNSSRTLGNDKSFHGLNCAIPQQNIRLELYETQLYLIRRQEAINPYNAI